MTIVCERETSVSDSSAATTVAYETVAELMQALHRVARIGVYYPEGHSMCDQVAEDCLELLAQVVGKAAWLRIEVLGEALHVQGHEMDPELNDIDFFRDMLIDLGLSGLDIDADITSTDLYRFVTGILSYRSRMQSACNFQSIMMDDMPPTVRVRQRAFLATQDICPDTDEDRDGTGVSLDTLLASLARQGLDRDQLAQCRRFLKTLPSDLSAESAGTNSRLNITWADVEQQLLRVMRHETDLTLIEEDQAVDAERQQQELSDLIRGLGHQTDHEDSREALNLLVSMTRRSPASAEPENEPAPRAENAGPRRRTSRPKPTLHADLLAELREVVESAGGEEAEAGRQAARYRSEDLVVLMQMLEHDLQDQGQARLQKHLHDHLKHGLQMGDRSILVAGLRRLAELESDRNLAVALTMIAPPLRRAETGLVLSLLREVNQDAGRQMLEQLWPFLLNEILVVGKRPDPTSFRELCEAIGGMPESVRQAGLARLPYLEVVRDKQVARDVFDPLPEELYGLMAELLACAKKPHLGKALMRGLQRTPPNWIGKAVLPLIGAYHPRYRKFLIRLLQYSEGDTPQVKLAGSAGRYIAELLPNLPTKRRPEPWVRISIRAIPRLPVEGGQMLLQQILDERRWLVVPVWPAACRSAAREALREMADGTYTVAMAAPSDGDAQEEQP